MLGPDAYHSPHRSKSRLGIDYHSMHDVPAKGWRSVRLEDLGCVRVSSMLYNSEESQSRRSEREKNRLFGEEDIHVFNQNSMDAFSGAVIFCIAIIATLGADKDMAESDAFFGACAFHLIKQQLHLALQPIFVLLLTSYPQQTRLQWRSTSPGGILQPC